MDDGREFFEKRIRPQLGEGGEHSRRAVFKAWLTARREDAGKPGPGAHCAAGWKALGSLGTLIGLALGGSVTAALLHYKGEAPVNVATFPRLDRGRADARAGGGRARLARAPDDQPARRFSPAALGARRDGLDAEREPSAAAGRGARAPARRSRGDQPEARNLRLAGRVALSHRHAAFRRLLQCGRARRAARACGRDGPRLRVGIDAQPQRGGRAPHRLDARRAVGVVRAECTPDARRKSSRAAFPTARESSRSTTRRWRRGGRSSPTRSPSTGCCCAARCSFSLR